LFLGEFPWQISLQRKSGWTARHMCGGSILSENVVITAAHCTKGNQPYQLQILAGADSLSHQSGKYSSGLHPEREKAPVPHDLT